MLKYATRSSSPASARTRSHQVAASYVGWGEVMPAGRWGERAQATEPAGASVAIASPACIHAARPPPSLGSEDGGDTDDRAQDRGARAPFARGGRASRAERRLAACAHLSRGGGGGARRDHHRPRRQHLY